jgi:hypothetical protein
MSKHFDPAKRQERHREQEPTRNGRRPFNETEIDELPRPRSDDPPYQNWWVIDARTDRVKL